MTNILEDLQSVVTDDSGAIAIDGDRSVTYSGLWSATDRFAGGLRRREVGAGDTVGICISDPCVALVAVYGTLRNGSIPVTIPPTYDDRAVAAAVSEAETRALVVEDRRFSSILTGENDVAFVVTVDCDAFLGVEFDAFVDNSGLNRSGTRSGIDVMSRADTDTALIAYLDRNGGPPLAVEYSHTALRRGAIVGRSLSADDRPTCHLATRPTVDPLVLVYEATATLLDGGTYRHLGPWNPNLLRTWMTGGTVSRVFLSRNQYDDLRTMGFEPGSDGVAVIEPPTALDGEVDGTRRLYGSPETGITHVKTPMEAECSRLGKPVHGAEATVLEDEQRGTTVAITGPAVMDGYHAQPDLTDESVETIAGTRWVRTNALASVATETAVRVK